MKNIPRFLLLILIGILACNGHPSPVAHSHVSSCHSDLGTTRLNAPTPDNQRVAVVTGGNKGIGYAIVKGLLQSFDGIVYLTARNEAKGLAAVEELKKAGFNPRFHQLDVLDDVSVERFRDYLRDTHGGLDVLVNNAGIAFKDDAPEPLSQQAEETIALNYFGVLRVSNALFPLLRPHARVVQMSSNFGRLVWIPDEKLKAQLSRPDLTEAELSHLMTAFVEATKTNSHQSLGWPAEPYTVSKVGVAALSRIQQRAFDSDVREDIAINAAHPGYVDTDLTSHLGEFTPERGAQSALWLASLPINTDIKGKFAWHNKTLVDWVNSPADLN